MIPLWMFALSVITGVLLGVLLLAWIVDDRETVCSRCYAELNRRA